MRRLGWCTLVWLAACAGRGPAPAVPAPAAAARVEPPPPTPQADSAPAIPPPPILFSSLDSELAEALRIEADSAADEAILERLFAELPDSLAGGADEGVDEGAPGGTAGAGAVTFDIDVERFNTHNRVRYYLNFFQGMARERFAIWLSRMPKYEVMIRRRLQQEGLPSDLIYLALIESGFSNTATSRARAVGMWQFMKGTGKLYGLRIDRWVDERRDPYRATGAAARHLKDLTDRFGSHYLAAAAYNAGAGRVSRGLVRLPDDDSDTLPSDATFFRLYDTKFLRRETKDYVPKLIAAAMIAKDPARYGFPPAPAPAEKAAPYDSLIVEGMTSFDVLARLADTTVAAIRELNPQYLRLATPPNGKWIVRLPVGRGEPATAGYAALPASERVTFREHTIKRGETLSGLARRYGVAVADLRAANPRLRGRALRPGQLVIVPTRGPISAEVAVHASAPDLPDVTWHRVKRGETLGAIARRYAVSQRQVQAWNGMGKSTRIRAGQRLRVSAAGSGAVATQRTAKTRVTSNSGARAHNHVVRRGETLAGLARRYGVTVQALRDANNLAADEVLKSGTRLRIPA
ncbi:MAG TPA: LysM peptidoglycan-binding domain-containing protein [Gemmatimonadales bacterium]|nr:LysM peptidoglycan-binding domain-containing protein [Gemmatimonadales bacterium]